LLAGVDGAARLLRQFLAKPTAEAVGFDDNGRLPEKMAQRASTHAGDVKSRSARLPALSRAGRHPLRAAAVEPG